MANQTDNGLISGFCYWNETQATWIVIIILGLLFTVFGVLSLWFMDRRGWIKFDFPYEMEGKEK